MSVNRRRFLQDGALAAAACAATPFLASLSWAQQRPENVSSELAIGPHASPGFTGGHLGGGRQSFEGLLGSSFKVTPQSGGGAPVWVRLTAVDDLPALLPVNPASMAVPPKKIFSSVPTTSGYMLGFSGPGTTLAQGTYVFENEGMGSFEMFVVPGEHGSYTAVFNLLDGRSNGHFITTSQENGAPARLENQTAPSQKQAGENLVHSSASEASFPSQQAVEPALRDSFKTKLPE
jgi:hypothetical protein